MVWDATFKTFDEYAVYSAFNTKQSDDTHSQYLAVDSYAFSNCGRHGTAIAV